MAMIVLLGVYLSYNGHRLLNESRERVDHTQRVIAVLNKLFISLEDAETGQRGFVITGQERYLAPYNSARTTLPELNAVLTRLFSDTPVQSRKLGELHALAESKLGELERVIQIRRSEGFEESVRAIESDEGKDFMDRVRLLKSELEVSETGRLATMHSQELSAQKRLLHVSFVVGGLSIVMRLFIAAVLVRLRKSPRRRRIGSSS